MNHRLQVKRKAFSQSDSTPVRSQSETHPYTFDSYLLQPGPRAVNPVQTPPVAVKTQPKLHSAKTQPEIENEALQPSKFEATKLELQLKAGTITSEGQERLAVLQAQTLDLLQRRRDHAARFGYNLAKIAINRPDTPPPQSIRPKLTIGQKQESNQETFIDQSFPPPWQRQALSMGRLPMSQSLVQPKLTIGQPGDKYEQEADRVATQVVNSFNTPAPQQLTQAHKELQMKPTVQLQASGGGLAATEDLESSIQQARGGGQPLADNVRKPMEQAFGADFSRVKVHTDAQADQLNQSIQAKAFTTGQDVFFRQGEYNPGSRGGQELIAHELTHVVQQNGGTVQRTLDVATTPKLKGEDYANNVQKLIDMIIRFIPNFADYKDLKNALDTINNNRSLASVDSNEVAGQDQNTQAYGNYVKAIEDNLKKIKFKETDQSTYNKARNELVPELNNLFDQLPHQAVDSRVGQVIDSPTTKKYKKTAKQEIDNALQSLAVAMKHQIDVLLPKR